MHTALCINFSPSTPVHLCMHIINSSLNYILRCFFIYIVSYGTVMPGWKFDLSIKYLHTSFHPLATSKNLSNGFDMICNTYTYTIYIFEFWFDSLTQNGKFTGFMVFDIYYKYDVDGVYSLFSSSWVGWVWQWGLSKIHTFNKSILLLLLLKFGTKDLYIFIIFQLEFIENICTAVLIARFKWWIPSSKSRKKNFFSWQLWMLKFVWGSL